MAVLGSAHNERCRVKRQSSWRREKAWEARIVFAPTCGLFFFCDCELPRLALGKCVFVKVVVCMASCIHCAAYFNKTSFNWPEACVKAESQLKINLIFLCCCLSFCTLTFSWIFFCFFSVLAYYSLLFLHVISMFSVFLLSWPIQTLLLG